MREDSGNYTCYGYNSLSEVSANYSLNVSCKCGFTTTEGEVERILGTDTSPASSFAMDILYMIPIYKQRGEKSHSLEPIHFISNCTLFSTIAIHA